MASVAEIDTRGISRQAGEALCGLKLAICEKGP